MCLVGIYTRGVAIAQRLRREIAQARASRPTSARSTSPSTATTSTPASRPSSTSTRLDFPIDGRTVVLVDDVLYTGRTIRAAIDALFDYGRPPAIRLAVLADRGHRELPIRADYVGKNLPTSAGERVFVRAGRDRRGGRGDDPMSELQYPPADGRGASAT